MSDKTIRKLMETRLSNWAAARNPALVIAFENGAALQPSAVYLRGFMLKAPVASLDLEGKHRLRVGVYQISIVCVNGTGPQVGDGIVTELETLFPNNLRLTESGFVVQVIRPISAATAIQDLNRYTIPVSINYRSDSTA